MNWEFVKTIIYKCINQIAYPYTCIHCAHTHVYICIYIYIISVYYTRNIKHIPHTTHNI